MIRLQDLITEILSAHSRALRRLADQAEGRPLLSAFRSYQGPDLVDEATRSELFQLFDLQESTTEMHPGEGFEILDSIVRQFHLPKDVEECVWSLPLYRTFIEAYSNLEQTLTFRDQDSSRRFFDLVCKEGENYFLRMTWDESWKDTPKQIAKSEWLKFRTHIIESTSRLRS